MVATELIQQFIVDSNAEEGITQDLLDYVDLDVMYSPVIAVQGEGEADAVDAFLTEGGRYLVLHPLCPRAVTADVLKVMRLRYILAVKQRQRRRAHQWEMMHGERK